MTTNASPSCPQCGAPIPEGSTDGLCPRCVFAKAMAPIADGEAVPHVPPTLESVRAAFPQLEVTGLIGCGGMGSVFKARQPQLDRFVALKILPTELAGRPGFSERFQREAQALARLSHPHIVTIHDFGQAGGFYFILMEFIDGVNLRQLLQTKRLTPREALSIVPPVCEALQCAHDHGIVHRDIKPENLLIDKAGTVKIADFGIAKMIAASSAETVGDAAGAPSSAATLALGTPDYAAPEQRDASAATDHRADIYSLGVVLYEMLTGERPTSKLEAPSRRVKMDVRIDEIVLRALETKPELRYQTVAEMRTQVEAVTTKSEKPEVRSQMPEVAARISRTAMVGAAWATLFFAVVPAFLWHEVKTHEFEAHGPFGSALGMFVFFVFIFPAFIAPFGTTLLGWISITQIRRSAGKLCGLGLAVFDALVFPLLALTALLAWFWWWLVYRVISPHPFEHSSPQPGDFVPASPLQEFVWMKEGPLTVTFTLLTAGILCFLLARRGWRAANEVRPAAPAGPAPNTAWSNLALGCACVSAISAAATWATMPEPAAWLPWSILIAALAALAVAIPVHRSPRGKWALWFGSIQCIAWAIIGLVIANRIPLSHLQVGFGPVVECVVADAIDLESGAMTPLPVPQPSAEGDPRRAEWFSFPRAKDEATALGWLRARGIDVIDLNHTLVGIDLTLVPLNIADWGMHTPAELERRLGAVSHLVQSSDRAPTVNISGASNIFGFKTREGSVGILQILQPGFTFPSEAPQRGVHIRYKLCR